NKLLKSSLKNKKTHITRFKGLGEMNPKTLWNTTLDPNNRNLLKIQIDNEKKALNTFKDILGKDASARYSLIQENAHRLELDV
ncbi:MAG: hypothetical protein KDD56_09595, partial [Bdellovibrionales bacterium]|nr:hypothetical protein [Bdellovibrionales bacterium]